MKHRIKWIAVLFSQILVVGATSLASSSSASLNDASSEFSNTVARQYVLSDLNQKLCSIFGCKTVASPYDYCPIFTGVEFNSLGMKLKFRFPRTGNIFTNIVPQTKCASVKNNESCFAGHNLTFNEINDVSGEIGNFSVTFSVIESTQNIIQLQTRKNPLGSSDVLETNCIYKER